MTGKLRQPRDQAEAESTLDRGTQAACRGAAGPMLPKTSVKVNVSNTRKRAPRRRERSWFVSLDISYFGANKWAETLIFT